MLVVGGSRANEPVVKRLSERSYVILSQRRADQQTGDRVSGVFRVSERRVTAVRLGSSSGVRGRT